MRLSGPRGSLKYQLQLMELKDIASITSRAGEAFCRLRTREKIPQARQFNNVFSLQYLRHVRRVGLGMYLIQMMAVVGHKFLDESFQCSRKYEIRHATPDLGDAVALQ
jgi:hypothetical protein